MDKMHHFLKTTILYLASLSPEDEDGDTVLHSVLTKHFDTQGHSGHHPQLPNPVIGSELRKHDNAPVIAEV